MMSLNMVNLPSLRGEVPRDSPSPRCSESVQSTWNRTCLSSSGKESTGTANFSYSVVRKFMKGLRGRVWAQLGRHMREGWNGHQGVSFPDYCISMSLIAILVIPALTRTGQAASTRLEILALAISAESGSSTNRNLPLLRGLPGTSDGGGSDGTRPAPEPNNPNSPPKLRQN